MPLETVAGATTFVSRSGSGVRRTLFVHCSLAHSGAWRGVERLLTRQLAMTALDLPGHGRSADWDGQGDYQGQAARIVEALIDRPLDLVGHSYGATIALRIAQRHPGKVRSLTLIEPVLFHAARAAPEYAAYMDGMKDFEAAIEVGDRPLAARLFNRVWGTGQPWDAIPELQRQAMIDRIHLIPAGAPVTNHDVNGQAAPGALEAVALPVLLIEGSKSPPIISAVHRVLDARLPDTRRVVVAGAGHMVPITHPKAVAGELKAFLKL
ncbi:alpha/beta hydrolase [Aliiroseovarius subalbicans]|uniref:alpha/beta fold hydrolase n=1 Tax=Aliiroseovarius subalbicans TaxID=2925840 RepID=UPI001F59EDB8|nr:alpha/beta hydrolase [Aliiroseovarius subalbicans]MCI2400622.1 alpha/beta hydrolase [Aliiroseovarius subalbicans]